MKRRIESASDVKKAHSLLDRRETQRAPVNHQATYTQESELVGEKTEGTLADLSKTGCHIQTPHPPPVGSKITLTLALDDDLPPLCLAGTTVCRITDSGFGATFPALSLEERKRIQAVIFKRVTLSDTTRQRVAFRLA
ncbi:MAG TPA: PilZ domain-containing protein [Nitrospira sp.]